MGKKVSHIFNFHLRYQPPKRLIWPLLGLGAIVLVYLVAFQSTEVSTSPVGWEKSFFLTPYSIQAANVQIASRGNLIVAVYEDKKKRSRGIYASISFNGGKKFLQPVKITNITSAIDQRPHVAISGNGHIAVVWQSLTRNDPNSRIFYSISTNMGAIWSQSKRLYLSTESELLPSVFYDDINVLHIFYNGMKGGVFNLFHIVSFDEKIFGPSQPLVNISGGLRGAFFPAILFSGKYVFISWQGKGEKQGILSDDLFFIRSDDYGKSFSSKKKLTESKTSNASPSIALVKDIIYLVYQNNEGKNWSIKLLKGYGNGDEWDKKPITISSTHADCYSPVIVSSNNDELVIIWHDTGKRKSRIFARKYLIRERKLSLIALLSKNNRSARKPAAISMGKRIIVSWEGGKRIVSKYSDIHVDPPVVSSITHPQDIWSRSSRARIEWMPARDESGIVGYATFINKLHDFNPTIQNIEGNRRKVEIPDLDNGITYFHIRTIDGAGNYSRTMHYKIQVSTNPLPMPVVTSQTHPEGKSVESRSPILMWSIGDTRRLKGFLYSFTKDMLKKPDIFTLNFEAKFHDLDEGRYFFNIRSVDKTNSLSRIATYEIIAGRADEINPDYYGRIAKVDIEEPKIGKKVRKQRLRKAFVDINFPVDIAQPITKKSFDAFVLTKNIRKKNIIGYSWSLDTRSVKPLDRVNLNGDIIKLTELKSGEYYLGVKCRYYRVRRSRKVYYWTKPVIKKFTISLPEEAPPLVAYMDNIMNRLSRGWVSASLPLMTLVLSIMVGFSTKLTFYARLLQSRIGNLFRL